MQCPLVSKAEGLRYPYLRESEEMEGRGRSCNVPWLVKQKACATRTYMKVKKLRGGDGVALSPEYKTTLYCTVFGN